MQNRNWIVAVVAVVIGLIAVVIANAWFSGMEEKQKAAVVDNRTVRIVVATQPLQFGTPLTEQNLRLQAWPAASIPVGAFRTLDDALSEKTPEGRKPRFALRPIVVGEPVLADKVSGKGGRATLAALLPEGMRAYSIPVNATRGVSGFVLPGTMVDVILTRKIAGEGAGEEDLRADVILNNVQVLAVDTLADEKAGKPKTSRNATLAVSLFDAQRLSLATKMGTLSLALRKVESAAGYDKNGTPIPTEVATTVTGRQMGGPRLYVGKRRESGGSFAQAAPEPRYAPPPMPAMRAPPAVAMPPSGPSMTVFRGSEPTTYPVSLGGR